MGPISGKLTSSFVCFTYIFLQVQSLLCHDQKQAYNGPCNMKLIHLPLEVYFRKNISTFHFGWGLGWFAPAAGSFVLPTFFQKYIICYVMARSIVFLCCTHKIKSPNFRILFSVTHITFVVGVVGFCLVCSCCWYFFFSYIFLNV